MSLLSNKYGDEDNQKCIDKGCHGQEPVNRAHTSTSQISGFLIPTEESFHAKASISNIEQITKIVAK